MFRIESYITPIILSHIDKYVKDFRPQDAQVSLWGGEVAFQNLDVRLDVLEEELQLPFNVVSGHIHELTVRVPWTKIASEPIQITINTIEFVLKLKTTDFANVPKKDRKKSKTEVVQAPPGYMASLVNKIANNISIKLHNIILKYVEEDIVVSMNIQLLSFDSADENWNPAFVDINPTKVVLKKVINISDLTICLDKRNSLGKIDICQEPILYRCTLQARMLRKYNISSVHSSSITRIDIFTESIELNVSAQQYPMLQRLLLLGMALREGKIQSKTNLSTNSDTSPDDENEDSNEDSMISWVWSMIPSIFPIEAVEDEDEKQGHFLHTGIYINSLKITFKSQEITSDNIVHSTKKIKYHPILKVTLSGIYADAVTLGARWFNMKGGISYIGIFPLGLCTCGKKHIQTSIFTSADILYNHKSFLEDSLKDENCPENKGQMRSYNSSWASHLANNNEEYLLHKTPAIAFDIVHQVEIPDDVARSSNLGSDLEYSNLSENYLCRAIISSFNFKYNSSFTHILQTLNEYSDSYDYAPYAEDKVPLTLAQLSPPSTEDFEALINDIPIKTYQLSILKPVLEIYVPDHFHFPNKHDKRHLPHISVEVDRVDIKSNSPYYPNRLVHTTCQLPDPPNQLLDNCYTTTSGDCKNLSINLLFGNVTQKCVYIPNIEASLKFLIKPDFWQITCIPRTIATTSIDNIIIKMSKPQLILNQLLLETFKNGKLDQTLFNSTLLIDIHDTNISIIDFALKNIYCTASVIEKTIGVFGNIKSIHGYSYIPKTIEKVSESIAYQWKTIVISDDSGTSDLLKFSIQLPLDFEYKAHAPIVSMSLNTTFINLDPLMYTFLNYEPKFIKRPEINDNFNNLPRTPKKSVVSEKATTSKKFVVPVESVHSSSEPTVTVTIIKKSKAKKIDSTPLDITFLHNIARCLVVQIDIKQCTIYSPDKSLKLLQPKSSLCSIIKSTPSVNYAIFRLPCLTIKSSHVRTTLLDFEENFPILLSDTIWNHEKDGFPWNLAMSNISCCTIQNTKEYEIVSPIKTNITLAVTTKVKKDYSNKFDHSFAIHIDTPPIQINLCVERVHFMYNSLILLLSLLSKTYRLPHQPEPLEINERSSSPNYHSELKEFFGTINTISENSSEDTLQEYEESQSKISIWIQWTLAKFTLKLFAIKDEEERTFIIELEDLITSIDKQDIYMKIKTKVSSISGICKTKLKNTEWKINDVLGLIARSEAIVDNLQDTFFELTITKAVTKNVHNKWGTKKKKNFNLNDTITEIMINMQTIDVKLNLDILSSFLPIFGVFSKTNDATQNTTNPILSVADLPLVFFQSKGIRIFIPMLSNTESCNVFIFKINTISITPTVENPLNRIPLRGDIYTKAAQLRILNIPGSKIEDRQYEVMFQNISIGSGKWEEILRYMDPYTNTDAYNENPAFDWNNQTERPSVEINTIFKDFNLSVTYAPCIIFKNVLVCGQGLEVNCLTDLMIELNTQEVRLLNNILAEVSTSSSYQNEISSTTISNKSNIFPKSVSTNNVIKITSKTSYKTILAINEFNRKNKIFENDFKQKNISENQCTDSGFESFEYDSLLRDRKIKPKADAVKVGVTAVPYDISFVGGVFSLKLYHVNKYESTCSDYITDSKNVLRKRLPLFSAKIFQPNMLISQSVIDKTTQLSVFNMILKLGTELEDSSQNDAEFSDVFLDTRQGELDNFGIPPPLVKYKEYITPNGEKNLELHIKRPIAIRFSHKTLEKILAIKAILDEFTDYKKEIPPSIAPISTANKINIIKDLLYGANRFDFSIAQTDLDFHTPNEYDLKFSFLKYETKIEILDHPQKLNFDISLVAFLISTGRLIILSPLTMDFNGSFTQENWKRNPLVSCNISSHYVDISLGPENIMNILKITNAFTTCLHNYEKLMNTMNVAELDSINEKKIIKIGSLTHIPTPKCSRINMQQLEECYQDDLRAGAFQFIDAYTENALPLPYQIQIISKEGGIICWRYPQPRSLNYVQIFPVPFHTTTTDKLKCHMEYYSDAHNLFLPYCEFYLSEKEIQELELPKRKVTAEIWRIIVFQPYISVNSNYFLDENSSDDEDYVENTTLLERTLKEMATKMNTTGIDEYLAQDTKNILNIHPKALVCCMRIDSNFSSTLVPSLQVVVNISHLAISIKNNTQKTDQPLPDILKQYTLSDGINDVQSILKFNFSNLKLHGSLFQDKSVTLNTETLFSSSVLDYSYLTMQPLIEEFSIKFFIEYGSELNINIITDELRLRYGPSVGHTLAVSEQIWKQIFTDTIPYTVVCTRYAICNCTSMPLQFKQHKSDESLFLQSKECCFYAFRSDKLGQKHTFAIEDNNWEHSSPIHIYKEGIQFLKIKDDVVLAIKTEKMSTTQKKITIKGQIEFLNMTQKSFRVQYKMYTSENQDKHSVAVPSEFRLNERSCMSLIAKCDDGVNQCIKLQLIGDGKKGWSGEIPLHRTKQNTPWLVKVPTTFNQQFLSFWVRVLRENINEFETNGKYQRLHIIIWPLFMVRSMLAIDTNFVEESSKQNYRLDGRGQMIELQIAGTHETEHELLFDLKSSNITEVNNALLSFKAVDRNKLFTIPNKYLAIESGIVELEKPYEMNWPCSREEELRWQRNLQPVDNMNPIFKCFPSRNLSCSLMLDVLPWCLFINSIGCDIQLINGTDNNSCTIQSNGIGMPFQISNSFKILMKVSNQWKSSPAIYLNGTHWSKTQPYIDIPEDGSVEINILFEFGASKCLLTSLNENGVRIFILSSYFVICNFSNYLFNAWAFCVARKDKHILNMPLDINHIGMYNVPIIPKYSQSAKGIGITCFYNLSHQKKDTQINKFFNYFLALQIGQNEFSIPFLLNKPYSRTCFSVFYNDHYIPLALSVIENQGQQFISIHNDLCPTIQIENKTELNLYVAEAENLNPTKPSIAVKSINDEHFEWFRNVPPNTSVYYTPPSINENFPDKLDHDVGILIACVAKPTGSMLNSNVRWSSPVRIYDSSELFLHLPLHGDFKVIVNSKKKVIKITIDNINYKMEFNVKDIRTKILHPAHSDLPVPVRNYSNDICTDYQHNLSNAVNQTVLTPEENKSKLYRTSEINTKSMNLNIYINGLNITLYTDNEDKNDIKSEIISIYFDNITLFYAAKERTVEIGFSTFQIDNQLFSSGNFDFPVVLCTQNNKKAKIDIPSPLSLHAIKKHSLHNLAGSIKIIFYEFDYNLEQICCNIQPIGAYIEDKYINVLLDFMVENLPSNLIYRPEVPFEKVFCKPGEVLIPKMVIAQSIYLSEPFKLSMVRIEPLSVLLSVHTCMRMYIALDHSPLDFAPYERHNIYTLPMRFGYNLGMHYVSGAIFGAGWVVGSLEILGSPSGLARSVSTGLRDFLSMPVQGLLRGPWGFLVGITQGSASLLRNITAGTVNSVTKLAASVARNLDRLSLDDEHLQRTEALRRSRPQGITHGFAQGLTGLGISILGAVGGLARHPLEARSSVGVVTGFGRGLVGAVTKPISGAAELVALTGQGMLHTVGFNTMPISRYTIPRNTSLGPSEAKIIWKCLPRIFAGDQILFSALATMQTQAGFSSIVIAITPNLIVLLSMEKDELIEIVSIARAYPEIDDSDATLVILNVASNAEDEFGDLQGFQYGRVLQYVRDSSDQLPLPTHSKSSSSSAPETQENIAASVSNKKSDHTISFFMDQHLGNYFVKYIKLIKHSIGKL